MAVTATRWRDGGVEAALAAAKAESKPVLLYWGAQWCPPCNELKSQVFEDPRFAALTQPLVAVRVDGDDDGAQRWGERLGLTGYPTVLVLDADGRERGRLATAVSFEEFAAGLVAVLAVAGRIDGAATRTAGKAADGRAGGSDNDWRALAAYAWDGGGASTLGVSKVAEAIQKDEPRLATLAGLASVVPERLPVARATIFARTLEAAASMGQAAPASEHAARLAQLRSDAPAMLEAILATDETIFAARTLLASGGAAVLCWAFPGREASPYDARFLAAAADLAGASRASLDVRLWARCLPFSLHKARAGGPVPDALREHVQGAVAWVDGAATSVYDRHAVVSGAARLLRLAGDLEGARALLTKELTTTDTPWYYHSSFATLERAAGRVDEALLWSARARESVQGRASRIQWTVEDLALNAAAPTPYRETVVAQIARAYLDIATELPDGFSGRNATRARRVLDVLTSFGSQAQIAPLAAAVKAGIASAPDYRAAR